MLRTAIYRVEIVVQLDEEINKQVKITLIPFFKIGT